MLVPLAASSSSNTPPALIEAVVIAANRSCTNVESSFIASLACITGGKTSYSTSINERACSAT